MAFRRESGRAYTGRKPKAKPAPTRKLVRQNPKTSSLGSNAAEAHGYTRSSSKPIPKQQQGRRTDLKQAAKQQTDKEREVTYVTRMRRKAPEEAARQQEITDTERRLNAKATKGKIRYDLRTGNYVQHRTRRFLPDEDAVIDPKTEQITRDADAAQRQAGIKHAETVAPALKILDQTLRPTRAIAGATEAAMKGKNPAKAAGKGLLKNKGPTFGKVLREAGAPKPVAAVAGFGLDVATDPTTYVTGGTAKLAKTAGEKAAKDAAARAAKQGMPEQAQQTVAKQAARKAVREAGEKGERTGVTVHFAGRKIPGVQTATAAAGHQMRRVTPKRAREGLKETAGQVRPQITPRGVEKTANVAARRAERRARSTRAKGVREAQDNARLLASKLKPDEHDMVFDAIERGRIGSLPEHLRDVAISIRSANRHAARQLKRAGVTAADVRRTRAKVKIPEVTADTSATAKRVAKEQRREARIERTLREARASERVAQGRSEILSRNVNGRRGENLAIRAGNVRSRKAGRRAGGQVGVEQAQKAIAVAERGLAAARTRVDAATSAHEREIALAAEQRAARAAAEARAAEAAAAPREYMAHMRPDIIEGAPRTPAERGQRTLRPGNTKQRERKLPASELNRAAERAEDEVSTNIPLVQANYRMQVANAVAENQLGRELAEKAGRDVRPGRELTLSEGEGVYHVQGGRLTRLDKDAEQRFADGKVTQKGGRFVVLNDQLVERARKANVDSRTTPGKVFDVAQGKWKRLATSTPGFHVRNAIGDTQMAFLAQPARTLTGNTRTATQALRRMAERDTTQRTSLQPAARTHRTVKVAGKPTSLDDFLDDAINEGVIRSGQIGRELDEFRLGSQGIDAKVLRRRTKTGTAVRVPRMPEAVKRPLRFVNRRFQDREDLMRLATYKYGLDKGLSKEEAADLAMAFHIDYSDVTDFERKAARRVMPFYTFSARALPIHVRALVSTPGKIATIEKLRVELAQAFGLPPGWEGDTPEYKQRAIPFGVRVGGENVALDASLPLSLLNEVPTAADPKAYATELAKFGANLLTPAVKIPIETVTGQSLAFRKPIKSDYKSLVAAPSWATKLPAKVRQQLGIVNDYVDPQTGKKVAGWNAWTGYWFSQIPGLANQFRQLTTEGSLQSGRHGWQTVSGVLGVKADPVDAKTARISSLFEQSNKINDELTKLRQRGKGGGLKSTSPRTRALTKQLARINYEIYAESVGRGDLAPLRESTVKNDQLLKPRTKKRGVLTKSDQKSRRKKSSGGFGGGGFGSGSGFGGSAGFGGGGF